MAPINTVLVLLVSAVTFHTVLSTPARRGKKQSAALTTCPGFPGYCSESYPGQTCLVVCARGRNNVPECQDDGTWTDVPRCIEHEPGKQDQVPGVCPGVPGYCSLDNPGGLCTFECPVGDPIRSTCTPDGTWDPYPTCFGDPRETQDGCDPCPGAFGGPRNRTAEASSGGGGSSGASVGGRRGGGNSNNGGRKNNGGRRNNGNGNAGGRNSGNGNAGGRNSGNGNAGGRRNGNKGGNGRRNNQQPRSNTGFSANANRRNSNGGGGGARSKGGNGGSKGGNGGGGCPGEVLEACIDVCPGFSARVFSACVAGCARRCPGSRK